MLQEVRYNLPEKLPGVSETVETFQIHDQISSEKWDKEIWPGLEKLFRTTWPNIATHEYNDFFKKDISGNTGSVMLLHNTLGEIIGTSFIYPLSSDHQSSHTTFYPKDGRVAYNSTVIIDPRYRSQGLMIPLIEKTLEEASFLGYDYVVGHYNRATGVMPDGRQVATGFANRIKEHHWQNGNILFPTISVEFQRPTGIEYSENIIFQLPVRQRVDQSHPLRRMRFQAA